MTEPQVPSWTSLFVDSINQLRTDFKGDMALLNARLDRLVSLDVHQADLRRIDGRIDDLAADLGTDRLRANEVHTKIDSRLDSLLKALERERDSRIASVRWGIGTVIACAVLVTSILALIL